ncbi:hypothetical protein B0H14DRAFT_2635316 [Mycena olivaceomarginata]|nr:hypothetical protein B0H14DRAFT_2635316 [Mycena olivaceomarginata]
MREFHRSTRIDSVLSQVSQNPVQRNSSSQFEGDLVQLILGETDNAEAIGTVQDAAHADTQGGSRVFPGSVAQDSLHLDEEDILRLGLFKCYNRKEPTVHFALNKVVGTTMLSPVVELHNFALLDEVPTSKNVILVHISWMKRSNLTPLDGGRFPWDNYPQLGAETWEYDTYADTKDEDFPPIVLPLDEIHCQISRGKISHTKPPLWITTTMDRFPTSLLAYGFGDKVYCEYAKNELGINMSVLERISQALKIKLRIDDPFACCSRFISGSYLRSNSFEILRIAMDAPVREQKRSLWILALLLQPLTRDAEIIRRNPGDTRALAECTSHTLVLDVS